MQSNGPQVFRVAAQPVFTHRERQVLELVLDGLTNGEIAGHKHGLDSAWQPVPTPDATPALR
jgi:hypothetical protein